MGIPKKAWYWLRPKLWYYFFCCWNADVDCSACSSDMEAERVDGKVDVGFSVNNHDGCNFT